MKKILRTLIVSVFIIFLVSGTAVAVTIDFGTGLAGTGGTISSDLTNAAGSWIPIGVLHIEGAPGSPLPNGVYDLSGSFIYLSFDTSANWIKITDVYSVTYLSGSFADFAITQSGSFLSVHGAGPEDIAGFLLADFGIDPNTNWAFFDFTLSGNVALIPGTNLYSGNVTSTYVDPTTPVPEPTTMLLYGLGFAGAGLYKRMRRRK